jgi:hypothetical protein
MEIDKEFGEVIAKKCSFCNKTYNIDMFYPIPETDSDEALIKAYSTTLRQSNKRFSLFRSKDKEDKIKNVNEGICLKCMVKGIMRL